MDLDVSVKFLHISACRKHTGKCNVCVVTEIYIMDLSLKWKYNVAPLQMQESQAVLEKGQHMSHWVSFVLAFPLNVFQSSVFFK